MGLKSNKVIVKVFLPATLGLSLSACATVPRNQNKSSVASLEANCNGGAPVTPSFVPAHVIDNLSQPAPGTAAAASTRVAGKLPVLVYFAIDTGEPFMKLAVDHEVRSLRAACETGNAKVNWLAFLNSYLTKMDGTTETPFYAQCKAGAFSVEKLPPASAILLSKTRQMYAQGKKCFDDTHSLCLRIFQPYALDKGAEFAQFPLAHPEVQLQMLEFTRTIFPPDHYAYFFHFKSHGSEDFISTGLGTEQVKAKTQCQAKVMTDWFHQHPEQFVNHAGHGTGTGSSTDVAGQGPLGEVGLGEVGLGEVGLGEVGLGEVGLGEVGLGEVGLGEVGLGEIGLGEVGLGEVGLGGIAGLGIGAAGLNATNHYGTRHLNALLALRWFTTRGVGSEDIGFVFFESCESRASRFLQSSSAQCVLPPSQNPLTAAFNGVERLHAYYSAEHSLWYRNLDFDTLFKTWLTGAATVPAFQKLLIDTSAHVANYDFASADPLPLCPP